MKFFKYFLILILALIIVPLIIAFFVKKEYEVERQVIINQPVEKVFDYIKYLKNQDNYSKWATMDPEMNTIYTGIDGTVGFISRWESEKDEVGVGEQEITKMILNERIDYELRFIKPFESISPGYMLTIPIDSSSTKVIWAFEGKMNYPTNLFLLFMDMEKLIGDDLKFGLDKLKVILEHDNEMKQIN